MSDDKQITYVLIEDQISVLVHFNFLECTLMTCGYPSPKQTPSIFIMIKVYRKHCSAKHCGIVLSVT